MECVRCCLSEARVTAFMMHMRRLVAINTAATAAPVITQVLGGDESSRVVRGAIASTTLKCRSWNLKERELGRDVRWWRDGGKGSGGTAADWTTLKERR